MKKLLCVLIILTTLLGCTSTTENTDGTSNLSVKYNVRAYHRSTKRDHIYVVFYLDSNQCVRFYKKDRKFHSNVYVGKWSGDFDKEISIEWNSSSRIEYLYPYDGSSYRLATYYSDGRNEYIYRNVPESEVHVMLKAIEDSGILED